ncbi:hypothetical protein PMIN03_011985 [Paraphaeosphaeria minitans]
MAGAHALGHQIDETGKNSRVVPALNWQTRTARDLCVDTRPRVGLELPSSTAGMPGAVRCGAGARLRLSIITVHAPLFILHLSAQDSPMRWQWRPTTAGWPAIES